MPPISPDRYCPFVTTAIPCGLSLEAGPAGWVSDVPASLTHPALLLSGGTRPVSARAAHPAASPSFSPGTVQAEVTRLTASPHPRTSRNHLHSSINSQQFYKKALTYFSFALNKTQHFLKLITAGARRLKRLGRHRAFSREHLLSCIAAGRRGQWPDSHLHLSLKPQQTHSQPFENFSFTVKNYLLLSFQSFSLLAPSLKTPPYTRRSLALALGHSPSPTLGIRVRIWSLFPDSLFCPILGLPLRVELGMKWGAAPFPELGAAFSSRHQAAVEGATTLANSGFSESYFRYDACWNWI